MELIKTEIKDLLLIKFKKIKDDRGVFIKPWISNLLKNQFGENIETYITKTSPGTLRGLHYQSSNCPQKKLIICVDGKIEDLVVDMRLNSNTYGKSFKITLNSNDNIGILVPEECAHGIFSYDNSIYACFTNQIYSPEDELGISWKSIKDFSKLPVIDVSQKDNNLPYLK